MKKKLFSTLLISLSLNSNSQVIKDDSFYKKEKITIEKINNLAILDGLYNININEEFNILGDVKIDKDSIYISTQYLTEDVLKKFYFSDYSNDKGGFKIIKIKRSVLQKIDNNEMTMSVLLDKEYFNENISTKNLNRVRKDRTQLDIDNTASYLSNNYQIYLNDGKNLSGLIETKYSDKDYWSIENTIYYRKNKLFRGKTVYKKEFEDSSAIQIGDITSDGVGQSFYLNGLGFKYSTNYFNNSRNYTFLESLPQYSVNGFSLTPGTFNLYNNSTSISSSELQSGNYDVIMPYNAGGGSYRGYIKDVLGNTQEFNIPYYNSIKILKEDGLEYSLSAAKVRLDTERNSNNYGKIFFSGVAKYAVTKSWTQDFSFQHSDYFKNIYTAANFYIKPEWGIFQAGVNYNGKNQSLYNLGWEYNFNSKFNFNLSSSFSRNEQGFCIDFVNSCIKKQNIISVGYKLPNNLGSVGYQQLDEKTNILTSSSKTLTWSTSIDNRLNLSVVYENLNRSNNKEQNKLLVFLNYKLDGKYSTGLTYNQRDNQKSYQTRLSKREEPERPEEGYGFISFDDSSSGTKSYNLNFNADLDKFSYGVKLNKSNNILNSTLSLKGSSLYIPENNHLSFHKNSTGIIFVDTDKKEDQDGVPIEIIHENKLSGATNKEGNYVIVNAVPYYKQKIKINMENLPIDRNYEISEKEVIVPEYGVAKIKFNQLLADYDVLVKNIPIGGIFTIENKSFVIGVGNISTINKEGLAKYNSDNFSCTFEVQKNIKEYKCE